MSVKIPNQVKVGPHQVSIVWVGEMEDCCGDYDKEKERIRVDTSMSDTQVADTLLHEILHAIHYIYGIKDEHEEEQVVTVTATALSQVIQDNPDVVKFLIAKLK